jgi:hypothetical protein
LQLPANSALAHKVEIIHSHSAGTKLLGQVAGHRLSLLQVKEVPFGQGARQEYTQQGYRYVNILLPALSTATLNCCQQWLPHTVLKAPKGAYMKAPTGQDVLNH